MVASGGRAGLATLYSVPLGGTLLILDVLLGTLSMPAPIPAVCNLPEQLASFCQQLSTVTLVISALTKVNVNLGPSCTFSTSGGRKHAMHTPPLSRTLG